MRRLWLIIGALILIQGCGPDVDGTWDGSGDFFPGFPFSVVISINDGKPSAEFRDSHGQRVQIAVCDLEYNSDNNSIRFAFNPFAKEQKCEALHKVYLFKGSMGYGVMTGEIRDVTNNNKIVGRFRAIKRLE